MNECHDPTNLPAVDATQAGEGNLEIVVRPVVQVTSEWDRGWRLGPSIPTEVQPDPVYGHKEAVFHVTFVPDTASDHVIRVTFNDEDVPGT